jgi:3-hydroxyisobutyrate dehydrogenase-like beta-hydroxyacid dehydrogenase
MNNASSTFPEASLPAAPVVGILHPGAMGAALGAALKPKTAAVLWAADGRSQATSKRAELADLVAVRNVADLVRRSDVVISICPPDAALDVAREVAAASPDGSGALYLDANAVAPATVREIGALLGTDRVVDGAVIGGPPWQEGTTALYLSGPRAAAVAALFAATTLRVEVAGLELGQASAVKACFALRSKALPTLWLVLAAAAREYGVEAAVTTALAQDGVDLPAEVASISRRATPKAWRWIGEMEEAAAAFAEIGLPDGYSSAAAEVYRRVAASVERSNPPDTEAVVTAVRPKHGGGTPT